MKAVLFKSRERFNSFKEELLSRNIEVTVLDFEKREWINFDFSNYDIVIYYPSFEYHSIYPLSLNNVKDNLMYIYEHFPNIKYYPDPKIIKYYNDKYRQFLFLNKNNFPIPETYPLFNENDIEVITSKIGFPCVVKNRFGAGGDAVFKVNSEKELLGYLKFSKFNFINLFSFIKQIQYWSKKLHWYFLLKEKMMKYPFLSYPLLVQKFVPHESDLKVVLYKNNLIEAHWRKKAHQDMWKVNIDAGGVGIWQEVPDKITEVVVELAKALNSEWLNVDLLISGEDIFISEFSPVWHHYRYKEKDNFIYKEDYNLKIPLKTALNLEKIIVDTLLFDEVQI